MYFPSTISKLCKKHTHVHTETKAINEITEIQIKYFVLFFNKKKIKGKNK
jgi:hypothetical protein